MDFRKGGTYSGSVGFYTMLIPAILFPTINGVEVKKIAVLANPYRGFLMTCPQNFILKKNMYSYSFGLSARMHSFE